LPSDIESDAFWAAYQAAFAGHIEAKRERRETPQNGSIAALIESYLQSADYSGLRETTKLGYASRIEALRTQHGHRSVAGLTRERKNCQPIR
jgi:hypothetical protein